VSKNNRTWFLPGTPQPEFYTARAAEKVIGFTTPTIRARITPDAWTVSIKGDKRFPLYLRSTLEQWAAEIRASGLQPGNSPAERALWQQERRRQAERGAQSGAA
jgi:hypothetical protein